MKPPFHYEVRITNVQYISKNNINFDITTKSFLDDDPLVSRQKSLDYYIDYISGLLEHLGHHYESDKQSREILKTYIENGDKERIITRDKESDLYKSIFFGIGVFFISDKKKEEHKNKSNELKVEEITNKDLLEIIEMVNENPIIVEEQLIHGFGYYGTTEILPENYIEDLWLETEIYKNNGFDIDNQTIQIDFYDEEFDKLDTIEILPTPFNWSGYDVPRLKDESNEDSVNFRQNLTIEQIIENGETDQVEFKPSLLYNFKTKEGGIGIKSIIGRTICGFLNSRGGFLLIGVNDDGKPQGLSYDYSLSGGKNPRDFFRLEFDEMLEHFLPQWVQDNVSGRFIEVEEVEIFLVSVFQSKKEPIFLKGQNGREFYIRRMGSTKQLDIEQFYYYWKNHLNR